MEVAKVLAVVLAAYLVGAIPFGLIISRWFGVPDIRAEGSGNIGATNVWRVIGPRAALWVYVFDIGKGVAVVLAARGVHQAFLSQDFFPVCCGVAAVLGHVFPVYLGFRGGKGVNTALGVMVTLLPTETVISVGVFFLVCLVWRYVSIASMAGALALPAVILLETNLAIRPVANVHFYTALVIAGLVLVAHRRNIGRLLAGTESRFTLSSKANREGGHG